MVLKKWLYSYATMIVIRTTTPDAAKSPTDSSFTVVAIFVNNSIGHDQLTSTSYGWQWLSCHLTLIFLASPLLLR